MTVRPFESAGLSPNAYCSRIYQIVQLLVQHHTGGYSAPWIPSRQAHLSRPHQGLLVMSNVAYPFLGIRLHILNISYAPWPH